MKQMHSSGNDITQNEHMQRHFQQALCVLTLSPTRSACKPIIHFGVGSGALTEIETPDRDDMTYPRFDIFGEHRSSVILRKEQEPSIGDELREPLFPIRESRDALLLEHASELGDLIYARGGEVCVCVCVRGGTEGVCK